MARLFGILMLFLTVLYSVGASADVSGACLTSAPAHGQHVQHGPSDADGPASPSDHADMAGVCKLTCGAAVLTLPASLPMQIASLEARAQLPAVSAPVSVNPAPSERPPRPLI